MFCSTRRHTLNVSLVTRKTWVQFEVKKRLPLKHLRRQHDNVSLMREIWKAAESVYSWCILTAVWNKQLRHYRSDLRCVLLWEALSFYIFHLIKRQELNVSLQRRTTDEWVIHVFLLYLFVCARAALLLNIHPLLPLVSHKESRIKTKDTSVLI